MAGSRKPRSASAAILGAARRSLEPLGLRGKRIAAALSGGVDSVVLLHVLKTLEPELGYRLCATHVDHGLSPNSVAWRKFCLALCRKMKIPVHAVRVRFSVRGQGREAAARAARYEAYAKLRADAIALGHQLDDQAETVLLNLLRGAGLAGASAMPAAARVRGKLLLRPLLAVPRESIAAYARANGLAWVEDESNADQSLTRNYLRHRVGPLLAARFPRWRESLARAARHFAAAELDARRLLREFLAARGLRAPSEAKLLEMLKQLADPGPGSRATIAHDGATLRVYRGSVYIDRKKAALSFRPLRWQGQARLALPALGGELRFTRARGAGIDPALLDGASVTVRVRSGGERLQPDSRRPRRTLKNMLQEAGVPPWERARLPLLFCGADLVWVPGLGVDASYRARRGARGIVPAWRRTQ